MNQAISIDNYLHAHAADPFIVKMGKLGIMSSILQAEHHSTIYVDLYKGNQLNFSNIHDSWHNTFAKMLTESIQKTDIDHIFENVAVITFNYDRCIEHYLMYWLANYFVIDLSDAQEITNKLKIYHPYGQIGRLPWQTPKGNSVLFGEQNFSAASLATLAQQLRTFTERVEDNDMLEEMHKLLATAEKIVYLGFSFGSMNMKLLTTENNGPTKQVYGTVMGISEPNCRVIRGDIRESFKACAVSELELENCGADKLLNDYWKPILA